MTLAEQHRLITEAQAGNNKSRDTLVMNYLPIVHKQLRKYPIEFKEDGLQVGALALMHAITKFEVERGLAFTTYAMFWVKAQLKVAFYDTVNTICTGKNSRHITAQAMWAKLSDSELNHQEKISWISTKVGLAEHLVESVIVASSTASLDFNINQEEGGDSLESITPSKEPTAEETTSHTNAQSFLKAMVAGAMNALTQKERAVVEAYYLGGIPFVKIGETLGVSKQRADQIEKAARRKLLSALIPLEANIRTALQ